MNNANVTNMKTLVTNYKNDIIAFVYNGVNYKQRFAIADLVVNDLGIRSLKRFAKFKFEQYEMSTAKLVALVTLRDKLSKYMNKVESTKTVVKKTKKTTAKKLKGFGRGFEVKIVNKKYNFGDGKHTYEVYEVSGPKVEKKRYFVDEESVRLFIEKCNGKNIEAKALAGKGYQFGMGHIVRETMELSAAGELPKYAPLEEIVPAMLRDNMATRPEDTDK